MHFDYEILSNDWSGYYRFRKNSNQLIAVFCRLLFPFGNQKGFRVLSQLRAVRFNQLTVGRLL